jgi:tetratricopeptide (TPR) repeat protein
MKYRLLLVDGHGKALTSELRIRTLREFPGLDGLSVHFRPVRNDLLFESAKMGGRLAYRILIGEGIVRSQLWVEYEVSGEPPSVTGRSSDLLFALALLTAKWPNAAAGYAEIAATGVLDGEGAVHSVEHTPAKIAAALRDLASAPSAVIFYPAADAAAVEAWRTEAAVPAHIHLQPVTHLEEALAHLGYTLDKVYLRNPFRGLEHFEYSHHAIFFGRDREVREAVQQLLRREEAGAPGFLVEGASGSGKSSFMQAGLLPALVELRFQPETVQGIIRKRPFSAAAGRAVWRPGRQSSALDETRLALSIRDCWAALPEFRVGDRRVLPRTLAELAEERRVVWPQTQRFVWVIDQFEELFNLSLPDVLIELFGRFLGELQADGAWTLASVRADALPQLKRHESLRRVFGANEGQYYLATLAGTALDAVISLPARAADLSFGMGPDGKPLDQVLREDAYRQAGSLPQLQFTLNELYQKRSGKELTYTAYQELGGLAGSIANTAERVLAAGGSDSERAIPRLFRSLVSVDDSGRATRRYAPIADITGDPTQGRILSRLIETRLCVTDQRDAQAVVAFAHDSLLQSLPALIDWLKREEGLLQTRELAQRETALWQQHGESADWLAPADKLAGFQALQAAEIVLPAGVSTFIARSAQRVRRTKRVKQAVVGLIALLGVGVIVAALAFGLQQRRAEEAGEMAARRGDFLARLLESANPRLGGGELTVAQLIDSLGQQMDTLASKEPLFAASMLGLVAKTDNGLGRYPEGLAANTRQLQLLRAHGAGRSDLADAITLRGEMLKSSEQYPAAESALREALALVQPGGSRRQLGTVFVDLGAVFHDTGREKDAESMYLRGIEVYRAGGNDLAESLVDPLADLGTLRHDQGRYEESAAYLREAVGIARRHWPRDHPELLDTEYNYAVALEHDHPADAEPILRELLASYQRMLGPNHVDTLMAQQGLAENLLKQRRYPEAAAEALPAAQGLSRSLGEGSDGTLLAWSIYGSAACLGGQGETGLDTLLRVAAQRKQSDADSRHLHSTQVRIGRCLVALRRYTEAEPILLEAVASLESERGAKYENTQAGYQALSDLYRGSGRLAEAGKWQAKVLPGGL